MKNESFIPLYAAGTKVTYDFNNRRAHAIVSSKKAPNKYGCYVNFINTPDCDDYLPYTVIREGWLELKISDNENVQM